MRFAQINHICTYYQFKTFKTSSCTFLTSLLIIKPYKFAISAPLVISSNLFTFQISSPHKGLITNFLACSRALFIKATCHHLPWSLSPTAGTQHPGSSSLLRPAAARAPKSQAFWSRYRTGTWCSLCRKSTSTCSPARRQWNRRETGCWCCRRCRRAARWSLGSPRGRKSPFRLSQFFFPNYLSQFWGPCSFYFGKGTLGSA